jgi:hypothetical protein
MFMAGIIGGPFCLYRTFDGRTYYWALALVGLAFDLMGLGIMRFGIPWPGY